MFVFVREGKIKLTHFAPLLTVAQRVKETSSDSDPL